MRTHKVKNLFFQFGHLNPNMTDEDWLNLLHQAGLIQPLDLDPQTGKYTRYAEYAKLYKCANKEALVMEVLREKQD